MPNLSLFEVAQIMQIPGFFKCDLNLSHSFRHVFFKLARAYRNWAATQDRKVNLALARHRKKNRVHIFLLGSLHYKQTQVNTFSDWDLLQTSLLPNGEAMEVPHHRYNFTSNLSI